MPIIEVHIIKGVFGKEQKQQVISRLTDAMVSIEGEPLRPFTTVKIHEVESGDWGIGGKAYTAEDIKKVASGG